MITSIILSAMLCFTSPQIKVAHGTITSITQHETEIVTNDGNVWAIYNDDTLEVNDNVTIVFDATDFQEYKIIAVMEK